MKSKGKKFIRETESCISDHRESDQYTGCCLLNIRGWWWWGGPLNIGFNEVNKAKQFPLVRVLLSP